MNNCIGRIERRQSYTLSNIDVDVAISVCITFIITYRCCRRLSPIECLGRSTSMIYGSFKSSQQCIPRDRQGYSKCQ